MQTNAKQVVYPTSEIVASTFVNPDWSVEEPRYHPISYDAAETKDWADPPARVFAVWEESASCADVKQGARQGLAVQPAR